MNNKANSLKPLWDILVRPVTFPKEAFLQKLPKNRRTDTQTKIVGGAAALATLMAAGSLIGGSLIGAGLMYAVAVGVTYDRNPKVVNKNNKRADANDPFKKALGDNFGEKVKSSKEADIARKAFSYVAAPVNYVKNTYQFKKSGGKVDGETNRTDIATKLALASTAITLATGAYIPALVVYTMASLYTYDKQPQGEQKTKAPATDFSQFTLSKASPFSRSR
jgi:hypothetical protein